MAEVCVEVMGVVLAILGWCLESSSTNSAVWRIQTHADSVIKSSSQYEGLWKSCTSNSLGVQCVTHPTTLGLPGCDWMPYKPKLHPQEHVLFFKIM
ncbi:claudin 15-like b isoform X1 [Tachysurus ichikawai]